MLTLPLRTRRFRPAVLGLALFAAGHVLVLNLAVPLLTGTSVRMTAVADAGRVLGLQKVKDADSWRPMLRAVRCLRDEAGRLLYTSLFFEQRTKFQYPPASLLLMWPAVMETVTAALGRVGLDWVGALTGVSWVLVLVTAALTGAILRRGLGGPDRAPLSRREAIVLNVTGAALTLAFYPVGRSYALGQIQVWINALFTAVVWCWLAGRESVAGVLAGVMCLLKPQYAFLLLWGTLRRRARFTLAGAATVGAGLALAVTMFGVANHLDYLPVLSHIARHGEGYYTNQSVNGLLNRLLSNGNNLDWDAAAFAPFHPAVYAGTLVSSATFLGLALLPSRRRSAGSSALDLGLAAMACTLASPVAWEHHYGVFLPIYAVLFGALCGRARSWLGLVPLAVSYALTANFFVALNRFADTPFNFLQSYVLAGGLLALGLAYRLRNSNASTTEARPSGHAIASLSLRRPA